MGQSDYSRADRGEAADLMAGYEGFGEMLSYGDALDAEQVAISWRRMPAGTGGRGSYGHRHRTQEEIYLVVSGTATFKVGDDVFECGPGSAVRVAPAALRSVHNDTDADVELFICSIRGGDPENEIETEDDFWPS